MRKKRVFRFSLLDTFVLLFALNILFCGIASVNGIPSLMNSIKILVYVFFSFVASNVIITSNLIGKIINSVLFSTSIIAAIGILGYFEGSFENSIFLSGIFKIISEIPFSSKEIYSEFLLVLLPFALAKSKIKTSENNQFFGAIAFILFAVSSLLTFEKSIILPLILGVITFAIVNKPILIFICFVISALIKLITIVIPSLFDFIYNFTANISDSTLLGGFVTSNAISSFDLSGLGCGTDALSRYIGTTFGHGVADNIGASSFFISFILQCGVISAILIAAIFILFVNKGFSYLSSKECNSTCNTNYMIATISSVTTILFKSLLFESFMSDQVILLTFVIFYLTTSIRQASKREYVPALYETMY